jgi:hypothetical protein
MARATSRVEDLQTESRWGLEQMWHIVHIDGILAEYNAQRNLNFPRLPAIRHVRQILGWLVRAIIRIISRRAKVTIRLPISTLRP